MEPSHVAPPCRPRGPDTFESTPPPQDTADENIPGRLPFDLYLSRSNRLARAAERAAVTDAVRQSLDNAPSPQAAPPARAGHAAGPSPRLGIDPTPQAHAVCPSPRPALQLIATRRGSILDVLA